MSICFIVVTVWMLGVLFSMCERATANTQRSEDHFMKLVLYYNLYMGSRH